MASGEKSKISCCSRTNIEKANERVALKDAVEGDLAERLHQRFQEIYNNAVHQNIYFDHKTWSEATEEGNSTIDFDPVDMALKERMDEKIQQLDDMIVETAGKRKNVPPELSRHLAKMMKSKRKACINIGCATANRGTSVLRLPLSDQELQHCKKTLQKSCSEFIAASKSLPVMEDKASRLSTALRLSESMAGSSTYQVLQKPSKDEATLATSLTPLKNRPEATPSTRRTRSSAAKKVRHDHPIMRYHLRSASKS